MNEEKSESCNSLAILQELSPLQDGEFGPTKRGSPGNKYREKLERLKQALLREVKSGSMYANVALDRFYSAMELEGFRYRDEIIRTIAPAQYCEELDFAKLPNPHATQKVLSWWKSDKDGLPINDDDSPYARGLLLFGGTGRGKTRSIVAWASELYRGGGEDLVFQFVRAVDLAAKVRTLAPRRGEELDKLVEELCWCPVLIIDDLHQAKLTRRYGEELFRIVDTRTSEERPIFVTCQMPGDELTRTLAADGPDHVHTAAAIVRRLRDSCGAVDFDYSPG